MKTLLCIYNPKSGSSISKQEIGRLFNTRKVNVIFSVVSDSDNTIENKITKNKISTIVACGGDGTVNRSASICARLNKTLGVIPSGTLNHFAKDLGLIGELEEAIKIILSGKTKKIDYCSVNEQIFVNNSSIGLYPSTVIWRESNSKKYGKWGSAFIASLIFLRKHKTLKAHIDLVSEKLDIKTPMIFVGNNSYDISQPGLAARKDLDKGKLFFCSIKSSNAAHFIMIIIPTFFGRGLDNRSLITREPKELTIDTGTKTIKVAMDGEVAVLENPLKYKIVSKGIKVLC